jgi:hypothetical protein
MAIYIKFSKLKIPPKFKMGNWVESLCDENLIKQTYLSTKPVLEIDEELIDESSKDLYQSTFKFESEYKV